jgi:hypothetical protein
MKFLQVIIPYYYWHGVINEKCKFENILNHCQIEFIGQP